ncbi:MAG: 16S rRNA (uracil(1498)-N(3))-methyltransferase [Rhodoluna sp.]
MVEPLFHKDNLIAVVGSTIELDGPEGKHAVQVRRMRAGEAIQLSDGQGVRARGSVVEVAGSFLKLIVEEVIKEDLPLRQITLVQALAKGDRDELAIQAATELGVSSVIPWQAVRSISRWDGPKQAKGQARWQQIVSEAAKQSLRAFTPGVSNIVDTNQLGLRVKDFDLVLVLDTTATEQLSQLSIPKEGKLAIVVGPEGGIDLGELEILQNFGAKLVSLGANVLRTSTAGPALIAALILGNA